MDLRDAAIYHMLVLTEEGAADQTQRHYQFYWKVLIGAIEALGLPIALGSLSLANVRAAVNWYRDHVDKTSPRQGDSSVRVLALRAKTFARFLEKEGIIPDDTLRKLRAPRVAKVLREPFGQIEVSGMWGACRYSRTPVRDEALFLLLLDTGMRIGEAATLTVDRLRLDQRQVIVGRLGKGRRERLVPLGDASKRDGGRTVRALRAYLAVRPAHGLDNGRVFLSAEGLPLSSEGAGAAIQRLGHCAGIIKPIPHRLRHTFCTQYLVMFPGDEIGLRRIVGHLSHDVLADYVHFAQSIIADRAGRASLAESWLGNGHSGSSGHGHVTARGSPRIEINGSSVSNVRRYHCDGCAEKGSRFTF